MNLQRILRLAASGLVIGAIAGCGRDAAPVAAPGTAGPSAQGAVAVEAAKAAEAPPATLAIAPANPATAPTGQAVTLSGVGSKGLLRFGLRFQVPAIGALFAVDGELADAKTGAPLSGASWSLDATMPDHGHGMETQPAHKPTAPGKYVSEGMKLHMHGKWLFEAKATHEGREDVLRVPFEVPPTAAR